MTPARPDINLQRSRDHDRPTTEAVLWARMRAVAATALPAMPG